MWKWIFTEQLLLEICGIVITLQFLASNKLKKQQTYRKWLIGKTRTDRVLFSGLAKFGSGGCYYDLIPTPKKSYWGMSNAYYPMKLIDFCTKYNNDIWHSAMLFNYPSGPGVIRPVLLVYEIQLCYLITLLDLELSDQLHWYLTFSYVI
jgi:hypothetical protein